MKKRKNYVNKLKAVRNLGYDMKDHIENYPKEELDEKIIQFAIDITGCKLYNENSAPKYSSFHEDGISGTECRYSLDKYGNLIFMELNDQPGCSDVILYHGDKQYHLDGFDFPYYAYAFKGDEMWYAGLCGSDVHIKRVSPDWIETIVNDVAGLDADMDEYLADFLLFRARFFDNDFAQKNFMELPCNIGDTLYCFKELQDGKDTITIETFVVQSFDIRPLQSFVLDAAGHRLNFANFGKSVFLSQEAARNALQKNA